MSLPSDAEDWLTLALVPGLGCTLLHRLVAECGAPAAVFAGQGLVAVSGLSQELRRCLGDGAQVAIARQRAQVELERVAALDIHLLTPTCPDFPSALLDIPDCPAVLYCRGDVSLLKRQAVAIVGSRHATEYGVRVATQLATELTEAGLVVVSGAAYGIDAAAHRGALTAGGGTVAVLGCGIDMVYPRDHGQLYDEIIAKGILVSEFLLGTKPEGFRFPIRNRIVSGLSLGVVVVEATEKSGSLITARLAADQGREVFAVPGRVDSARSVGAHRLIQQGATLVQTVADVLEGLSWCAIGKAENCTSDGVSSPLPLLSDQERHLLAALDIYPRDIDTLLRLSGLAIAEVHGLLLQLELKGLVRQLAGQLYERIGTARTDFP